MSSGLFLPSRPEKSHFLCMSGGANFAPGLSDHLVTIEKDLRDKKKEKGSQQSELLFY